MSGDKLPIVERLEKSSGRAFPSEPKTANEELCAEAATTITELVSALEKCRNIKPASGVLTLTEKAGFHLAKAMVGQIVDTALSNTRGDTKNDKG